MKRPKPVLVPLKPSLWWAVVGADGELTLDFRNSPVMRKNRKAVRDWRRITGIRDNRIARVEIREVKP